MAVLILPHDPRWARAVTAAVAPAEVTLHHIGSTAVPDILVKPIIDLLGEVSCLKEIDRSASRLEAVGSHMLNWRRRFSSPHGFC